MTSEAKVEDQSERQLELERLTRERQRLLDNERAWLEHHRHLARLHLELAKEHRAKAVMVGVGAE